MWIETKRFTSEGKPLPRKKYVSEFDYRIRFADTGKANVPEDVGKFVVSEIESFEFSNQQEEDSSASETKDE